MKRGGPPGLELEHHTDLNMPNNMTKLGLFALAIPVALVLSLSCRGNASISSDATPKMQSNAGVADNTQGDIHDRARSTRATSSLGFTEADFTRHVIELNA